MRKWIFDKESDLINLDHIENIMIAKVDEEEAADPGVSYRVLASNTKGEVYVLYEGSEGHCKSSFASLAAQIVKDERGGF
jgi:Fe-S cluster biogenesis protein NfuA